MKGKQPHLRLVPFTFSKKKSSIYEKITIRLLFKNK